MVARQRSLDPGADRKPLNRLQREVHDGVSRGRQAEGIGEVPVLRRAELHAAGKIREAVPAVAPRNGERAFKAGRVDLNPGGADSLAIRVADGAGHGVRRLR